jgi:molybdopterin-guanine dinucleotide biosynthesis protein A
MNTLFLPDVTDMSEILAKEDITGLVLAGGQSKRMGDVDKGLQLFHGKPLFLHATERLSPQVATLLVNANRHPESYAQAGFPVISDEPLLFSGPLAGFAVGLKYCKTRYMVTVPCDSPFFPHTLVQALGKALLQAKADLAVAVTGDLPPYAMQSVFCLMKQELLPHLQAFLKSGQRQPAAWYASLKAAEMHFSDETAFYNINTRKELEWLEKQ